MKQFIGIGIGLSALWWLVPSAEVSDQLTVKAQVRPFGVQVKATGELEAANSITVSAAHTSGQAKIISMVEEGQSVREGDLLVQLDTLAWEEKLVLVEAQIGEQKSAVQTAEQALKLDQANLEKELKSLAFDLEMAKLERDKVLHGDGPQELARLESVMNKAAAEHAELASYVEEVDRLFRDGFLNQAEVKRAQKQLQEAAEELAVAKRQFVAYSEHVLPIMRKRAESAVKKSEMLAVELERQYRLKLEKGEIALVSAKQQLQRLLVQRKDLVTQIEAATMRAPHSGMVVLRQNWFHGVRRLARAGDALYPQQALIDLPDLSQMVCKTKVRERDLQKVQVGKRVSLTLEAYPDLELEGEVASIGILAMENEDRQETERYFQVSCTLFDTDSRLRPGMTANLVIEAEAIREALTVPIAGVLPKGKKHYCQCRGQWREVKIGSCNEELAEVVEGLRAGEVVQIGG